MMTVVECLCTPIKVKYTIMVMGPSSHALLAASHLWHVGDKIEWESKDGGCDFYTCAHVAHLVLTELLLTRASGGVGAKEDDVPTLEVFTGLTHADLLSHIHMLTCCYSRFSRKWYKLLDLLAPPGGCT